MTVSSATRKVIHTGNGIATSFSYTFLIPDGTEVVSLYDTVTNSTTVLSEPAYSISGLDNPAGGSVTYNPSGTPIPSTKKLIIERVVPYTQALDINAQNTFFSELVETQLDRIVMQVQQLVDGVSGAYKAVPGGTGRTIADINEGHFLIADANGNLVDGGLAVAVGLPTTASRYLKTSASGTIEVLTAEQSSKLDALIAAGIGTTNGTLKTLNADGGFTIKLTGAPTIDIDSQAFGGTWKAHHYLKATTTGAHAGTGRFVFGVEHVAEGSTGASGAPNLDACFWFEAGKANWNSNQSIQGPITVGFVNGTNNAWSDLGGVIVNLSKPMTTTPGNFGGGGVDGNGSIVAWESTSRAYNMAGDTIIRDIHCLIGWDMVNLPGSVLAAGSTAGFIAEMVKGAGFAGVLVNGRSDLSGNPQFDYIIAHSINRNAVNIDFHITGGNHIDGSGLVRAGNGTAAKPGLSFDADDDTGIYRAGANRLGFATAGVPRAEYNSSGTLLTYGAIISRPGTSVNTVGNGDVTWQLSTNTALVFKAQGTDGVVRTTTLTLA